MERINRILNHNLFLEHLNRNRMAEADRIFCGHGMEHFLDVARIAYLLNLEERLGIEKEIIYAAALVHDLGKHLQYEKGIPHEGAGAQIAAQILPECGFTGKETDVIVSAVRTHREETVKEQKNLNGILYRADKLSRACFACGAQEACNWKNGKKNMRLVL